MKPWPVPVPTELSEPFWDAARRGDLVVPYCPNCELRFFVPEPACPGCMAADWHYVPSAGRGTVYSVTVVHRAPGPGFDTPFALAVIDLDDGATLLSHVDAGMIRTRWPSACVYASTSDASRTRSRCRTSCRSVDRTG